MRIRRIRLAHLGPYRGEAELDLDAVGPGLIAISGRNGAGKSTCLEAVPGCLWLHTPSRGPVANLATSRESRIELVGEHDGEFITRLDMDNVSGRSEAILIDGDGKPIAGPKVTAYKAAVASRFPPLRVYLAAAFSAQTGEGTLMKMDRAGRRALFAQLLDIERYERMAAAARKHADDIERKMALDAAALDAVRMSLVDVVVLRSDLDLARVESGRWAEAVLEAQSELRSSVADRDRLTAEAVEFRRLETAARKAQDRYERAADDIVLLDAKVRALEPVLLDASGIRAHAEAIRAAEAELAGLAAGTQAANEAAKRAGEAAAAARTRRTAAETQVRDLRTKMSAVDAVLQDADAIRADASRLAEAEAGLERLRAEGEAAAKAEREAGDTAARAENANGDAARASLDAERAVADAAQKQDLATKAIEAAERSTSGVPCAGVLPDDARGACPALVGHFRSIAEARKRLDDIAAGAQGRLDARERSKEAAAEASKSLVAAREARDAARHRAEKLRDEYRRLRSDCEKMRAADRSATLARAEAEAGVLREGLQAAESAAVKAKDEALEAVGDVDRTQHLAENAAAERNSLAARIADMRHSDRSESLAIAESEAATLRGKLEAARASAESSEQDAALAKAAVPPMDHDALPAAELAAAAADDHLRRQTAEAQKADRQVARIESQLEQAQKAKDAADEIAARIGPLERDLAEWRFLARALGREGVQALELDAAGPRVAQLANDLLRSCWDGRFQVRFDTQVARADGKGVKEDFAITVLDGRAGRETDGSDLSGGEKVVIGSAVGRAIGWFHRETSGTSFDQVFVDEATGELDEEARPQYAAMMRRLLAAGGLSQVWIVSHDPDLVALADAVVHVRDGVIKVMTVEEWRKAREAA